MEKVYVTMKNAGVFNVVVGIVMAIAGVAAAVGGAFAIVHGAKLLKRKYEIMF